MKITISRSIAKMLDLYLIYNNSATFEHIFCLWVSVELCLSIISSFPILPIQYFPALSLINPSLQLHLNCPPACRRQVWETPSDTHGLPASASQGLDVTKY